MGSDVHLIFFLLCTVSWGKELVIEVEDGALLDSDCSEVKATVKSLIQDSYLIFNNATSRNLPQNVSIILPSKLCAHLPSRNAPDVKVKLTFEETSVSQFGTEWVSY